jgi:carbon storage regulator CsrA
MLVLKRKNRESIIVGDSSDLDHVLKVTILEIRRGKVTLGIEGDRDVPVCRSELWGRTNAGERPCVPRSCR